jgi:hypothetical protein
MCRPRLEHRAKFFENNILESVALILNDLHVAFSRKLLITNILL